MADTMTPAALAAELTADPQRLGYAGKTAGEAATLMTTPGLSHETINPGPVSIWRLAALVPVGELEPGLSAFGQWYLGLLMNAPALDLSQPTLVANLQSVLAKCPSALGVLQTAMAQPATRAQALWGIDAAPTALDVMTALGGQSVVP